MQTTRDLKKDRGTAVGELELPITLVDLDDFTVWGASTSATNLIGLSASELVGQSALHLASAEDRPNTAAALGALRNGTVDHYRAHRRWDEPDGSEGLRTGWARAVEFGGKRFAFIEIADGSEPTQSPLAAYLGREPLPMAIGTIDPSWIITAISSDTDALLGLASEQVCGRHLLGAVAPDDIRRLLDAGQRVDEERSVALRIQLRDAVGAWTPLSCVLSPLAGEPGRLLILVPDAEASPRAVEANRSTQLEHSLRRIAAEIAASGILQNIGVEPDASHFPQLSDLSLRQWEVLSRLLRGERVTAIATALFVSQSTVRNHLSAIFERFGVHSQTELLSLLKDRGASPTRTDASPIPHRAARRARSPDAARRDATMTTWVVVLELEARPIVPLLNLDEIDGLIQAAAREGMVVRYSSALHSLQFEVRADTPQDALDGAMSIWRIAARKSGTRRWPVASVNITSADADTGDR